MLSWLKLQSSLMTLLTRNKAKVGESGGKWCLDDGLDERDWVLYPRACNVRIKICTNL